MFATHINYSIDHTYIDLSPFAKKITLSWNSKGKMNADIETNQLHLRMIRKKDLDYVVQLYSNPIIMSSVSSGKTKDREYVYSKYRNTWKLRREQSIPFIPFIGFEKESGKFVGQAMLRMTRLSENSSEYAPHTCELAGLCLPQFQNKGYGFQAAAALVHALVPILIQEGCEIKQVIGTAYKFNRPSNKIMEKLGMQLDEERESRGKSKIEAQIVCCYSIHADKLPRLALSPIVCKRIF